LFSPEYNQEGEDPEIDSTILYREGETEKGVPTYTPRAFILEARGQ
jgi:hypothetical protein